MEKSLCYFILSMNREQRFTGSLHKEEQTVDQFFEEWMKINNLPITKDATIWNYIVSCNRAKADLRHLKLAISEQDIEAFLSWKKKQDYDKLCYGRD